MKIGGFYSSNIVIILTNSDKKSCGKLIHSPLLIQKFIEQQYSQLMLLLHHDVILLVLLQILEHELVQLIQIYDDLMIR